MTKDDTRNIEKYINERVDDQIKYFDDRSITNQQNYKRLKSVAIVCNLFTTATIALFFAVPEPFKIYLGILALISSIIVLGTYQWEEFQSYGGKWEKFRLVAEQLKSEKNLFYARAGRYSTPHSNKANQLFVETIEGLIKGTDISYFALLVEPGKRIEKRLATMKSE